MRRRMVTPASSVNAPLVAGATDADLVRACAAGGRAVAFGELVRRHGRTVLAVCRGILGDGADADDAFQATFIVLLRRVRSIRQPEVVGGWLCGVAARVARRMRQRRTNTWAKEVAMAPNTSAADPPTPNAEDPAVVTLDRESQALVWAELGELPDKYRHALVLCHFDELTTEQAAAVLRCPVGTLRSRLLKARELLRARLLRKGVAVTAAALIALLLAGRATASPPPELIQRTTSAAIGGATPAVSQLADRTARDLSSGWWWAVMGGVVLVVVSVALFIGFNWSKWTGSSGSPQQDTARVWLSGPGTLLVVSQQDATVSLIDPTTGRTRATVATDPCPHEVSVSPNGRLAAVANYGRPFGQTLGGTVTIIDVVAGKKLWTVNVGDRAAPHGTWWRTDDLLLCTVEQLEAVVEIDVTRGKIARTLRTAQAGTHTVTASGNRAFTANVLSGSVSSLDLVKGGPITDRHVGQRPEGIAVSPDGSRVWVGNRADDTITVLAADDLRVIKTIDAPGMPLRMVFTPDGKTVVVAAHESGELVLFDAATLIEKQRVKMTNNTVRFGAPNPAGIAITPDGKTAYCTIFSSNAVTVVDLTAGKVTGKFDVAGGAPDGIAFSPISSIEDNG